MNNMILEKIRLRNAYFYMVEKSSLCWSTREARNNEKCVFLFTRHKKNYKKIQKNTKTKYKKHWSPVNSDTAHGDSSGTLAQNSHYDFRLNIMG